MSWLRSGRYLLPIALGLLGLLLLTRVFLADAWILVPEDADVILMVALLSVTMIVAVHTIVRISMTHLRLRSVQHIRRETLAEHRRFLSRLDHELKNPLTALRAGAQSLALTPLDDRQQRIVETMETETLRLNRLVADLRKLAELETQPLDLRPVQMTTFIMNIAHQERERFEAAQRTLLTAVDATQEVWVVDEDLLALAIHNLLDNAFKYTRPGGTVRLEATIDHTLTIRVVDDGVGIPPDVLPHVWEELYRAQPVAKISGSGIGLALVKAIVERHDGEVSITSTPNAGTSVLLRLPPTV